MTKIILMPQTMSLFSQQSIDELTARGTIKFNEENKPYLSIEIDKYLEVNIKTFSNESETNVIQE